VPTVEVDGTAGGEERGHDREWHPRNGTVTAVGEGTGHPAWEVSRRALDGLPGGGGLNIAHEAVHRHVAAGRGDTVALRWLGRSGERRDVTYAELATTSARFASALVGMGVQRGERVFTLLGRVPELYVTALGTLGAGAVLCPLFAAFGPEPVRQRLALGDARVLVTTPALYRRKVAPIRHLVPGLEHVLLVGDGRAGDTAPEGTAPFAEVVAAGDECVAIPPTDPEDPALLHFTSGTTGAPKGAVHVHGAVVWHHLTARLALGLRPGDVYWCTADPGWVTGTSYGIVAPLVHGATCIVDEGELHAERWWATLADERVAVWYTSPTAVRMLMRAGAELPRKVDLSALRVAASVGEPLNPEAVAWAERAMGMPLRDTWWQTETGGIMIATTPDDPVRPGSMGRALPGVETAIVALDDRGRPVPGPDGEPVAVAAPGDEGELALRVGWPSMFRGYLGDDERYRRCFTGSWYRTGDLARRDAEGWHWFVGRADDVISSAGHLVGPFEVESALVEHPAVVEAGAIGVADPVAGELVKAFVTLAPGVEPTEELRLELLGHARSRLGPAVAPRTVAFDQHLPRTRSGKILRRVLRARERGEPEGDLSTLEADEEETVYDVAVPEP
jgi:acetyl-CoA synthetase